MMKLYFIVNPRSGGGKGPAAFEAVKPVFEAAGSCIEIHETRHAGHAEELANHLDFEGYDGLCAIGGDGTLHELVNGVLSRIDGKTLPIGLIAGGTGNSLLRDLDCLDPVETAKRIVSSGRSIQDSDKMETAGRLANGVRRRLDIAQVEAAGETIYGFNIVGWGLPAAVNQRAEKLRWLRGQRYNAATVVEVLKKKKRLARISIDGREIDGDYEFILGCNTIHTGNGMKLAPRARIDDGLIDLVVARRAGRLKTLSLFPKIFDGSHLEDPIVEYHQAKTFAIEPLDDDVLNVDGEIKGNTPVTVTMLPGAVELLI